MQIAILPSQLVQRGHVYLTIHTGKDFQIITPTKRSSEYRRKREHIHSRRYLPLRIPQPAIEINLGRDVEVERRQRPPWYVNSLLFWVFWGSLPILIEQHTGKPPSKVLLRSKEKIEVSYEAEFVMLPLAKEGRKLRVVTARMLHEEAKRGLIIKTKQIGSSHITGVDITINSGFVVLLYLHGRAIARQVSCCLSIQSIVVELVVVPNNLEGVSGRFPPILITEIPIR